jgi:two-component system chemotaxis sensor kinase CheA
MMDHGIESIEKRALLNKPYLGTISINIIHDEKEIVIIIENDGAPFDLDKIKESARKSKGNAVDYLTEEEQFALIFEDDVSTSEQVSELSGRGVGLSAVKYEVTRLAGRILLESDEASTKFIFKLPHLRGLISKVQLKEILINGLELFIKKYEPNYTKRHVNHVKEVCVATRIPIRGVYDTAIEMYMPISVCPHILKDLEVSLYQEGLNELLNTILGHALQVIPGADQYLELGVPEIIEPEEFTDLYELSGDATKVYFKVIV